MKKRSVSYALFLLLFFALSCKKEYHNKNSSEQMIQDAQQFFNAEVVSSHNSSLHLANATSLDLVNKRKNALKAPTWEKAYIVRLKFGTAVVVPMSYRDPLIINSNFAIDSYYSLNNLSKLLVYKDETNKFHAEVVTAFPDSSYKQRSQEAFKGIMFVEDWWGKPIKKIKKAANNLNLVLEENGRSSSANQRSMNAEKTNDFYVCYEIYGFNYALNLDTVYWAEPAGCTYVYGGTPTPVTDDNPELTPNLSDYGNLPTSSADSGLTVPIEQLQVQLFSGNDPIKNAKQYFKCFTNVPGSDHKYTVRLCVDPPEPGTDKAWGFSLSTNSPVFVGHTFLILSEESTSATITRSVGFYPVGSVRPGKELDQGVLNNDELHDYDMSLAITLDNGLFFKLLDFVSQGSDPGYSYNLSSNNCTTFALNALSSIGINSIPRTQGTWIGGKGLNPGSLNKDLNTMTLAPNMTRTTMSGTHLNLGTCN